MIIFRNLLLLFLVIFSSPKVSGQKDTLVFQNGNLIVGEIKSMDRGVLYLETDYSDSDFKIKWVDVEEVFSETRFLISTDEKGRLNGRIRSASSGMVIINTDEGEQVETSFLDIVYLKGLKSHFWNRVSANIDIGLTVTRSNNLRQFSVQSAIGYLADNWSTDLYYNDLLASQDSIENTRRKDGGLNYRFYLPKEWYASPELSYLSNTEQALKSRITGKIGMGRFIRRSNKSYWGVSAGLSVLKETFTNDTDSRKSGELYAGTEINLFDIGDLSFLSNVIVYPSLTEAKRFRMDFRIDAKYEFLDDFYVKFNLSLNYDNQPAVQGKETDYVYGISFGWEL
jgi:hypothetical protein